MGYVGPSLKSISKEEMMQVYGTNGEVHPNSTPITITPIASAIGSFVGSYLFTERYCK